MKILQRFIFAIGFCALLSLVIYACKKPTEDLNVIIKTDALSKSPALVQFVNANTGSTTALPNTIKVSVSGPNADAVQTDDGGTNFTATGGFLSISLNRHTNPTPANPIVFTLSASVSGYAPVSKTVTVTNDSTQLKIVMPLVEYAKPADGTSSTVTNTQLNAGVSAATTISLPAKGNTPETNTLFIQDGTKMLDATGAVINTGNALSSSIVYYGTSNVTAYNAFPGGFNPKSVTGPNNTTINNVTFITAGFFSINMMAGNTAIKSFSKPVQAVMEINPDLVNPLTGNKVAVGDAIPLWSLDEATNKWKYESLGKVALNADGKLSLPFNITHLSGWAANWYSQDCGSSLGINIHMTGATGKYDGYQVFLASADDQFVGGLTADNSWGYTVSLFDGFKGTFNTLPANLGDVKVVVYAKAGDPTSKVAESELFSPCSKGSVDLNVPVPATVDYINADINVTGKCTSKQLVARPTTWMYLKDVTAGTTTPVYATNGHIVTKMISGHTYSMSTSYNGKTSASGEFKVDKTTNISIGATNGLSGTAVYDLKTNTLMIDATFTVSSCG